MPVRTRAAGIAIAAAAVTAAPAPAHAANAVYGGSTSAGAAIVVKADKQAKRLRSAVVQWRAACDDGRGFPIAGELRPAGADPGFQAGFGELQTSRNGKGRFAGTQLGAFDLGDQIGVLRSTYAGKLAKQRAGGTLSATIEIIDRASEATVTTCRTGSVRWSATRSPGRVYGGSTSQDFPIVVRLNSGRRAVADLLYGWESATCKPDDGFWSVAEHFGGFPLPGGRFGNAFDQVFQLDDGGERKFAYDITGRVAKTRASGTVRANVTDTDAAGTVTSACDSGTVSWSAATG
jgi:hypothetical protein